MDGDKLRNGIFALRTRRFGSVAECMVKRLLNCSQARSLFHDFYDDAKRHRIEVKFSVVQKKSEQTHYHYKTLTYDELYQLLAAKS